MPGGDRRGPEGAGPMTGRGLGGCADGRNLAPGAAEIPAAGYPARPRRYMAYRRGAGNGRAVGAGRRNSGRGLRSGRGQR
ncbi:MAG TPA: DUF5320 domain-containing protein [Halanaerobiales bacterium]|nr:DUF5320 domain-containing protein [Halanaerobiales bacterium]